jgi:hypothetical protein
MILKGCNRIATAGIGIGSFVSIVDDPFFDCGNIAIGGAFNGDDFLLLAVVVVAVASIAVHYLR